MKRSEWIKAAKFCRMTVPQYKRHLKATLPHLHARLTQAKKRKQPGYFTQDTSEFDV